MGRGQDAIKARLTDLSLPIGSAVQRLTIETDRDLRPLYDALKDGAVSVEIRPWRERRSLDANAYAWVLIDKLAAEMGISKTEVYRTAIREIGGVSDTVCVRERAADKLCESWTRNGIGWQTERTASKIEGCVNVTLYYGSSSYDTRQMSALIDQLVQDCKALDIDTLPPDRLAAMTEAWG